MYFYFVFKFQRDHKEFLLKWRSCSEDLMSHVTTFPNYRTHFFENLRLKCSITKLYIKFTALIAGQELERKPVNIKTPQHI